MLKDLHIEMRSLGAELLAVFTKVQSQVDNKLDAIQSQVPQVMPRFLIVTNSGCVCTGCHGVLHHHKQQMTGDRSLEDMVKSMSILRKRLLANAPQTLTERTVANMQTADWHHSCHIFSFLL